MNKRLKRIIAIALTISAFSTIQPTKYMNLFTTTAYASSRHIDNLVLNKTDTSRELDLYRDSDYDSSIEFRTSRSQYYAKTSLRSVNVSCDTDGDYETYVFVDDNKRSTAFEPDEEIQLGKGTTILHVRTYKEGRFDKNNVKNDVYDEYEIHVERTSSGSSNNSDLYLSTISLDYGKISFSKNKTKYNIDVNSSVDELEIKAKPSDEDYTVRIDGMKARESNGYKETVDLKKGKNTIEVVVTDEDDNEKIYTLNIYRGGRDSSSSDSKDEDNRQDPVYLDDLTLNNGDIKLDFSRKVTSYDVKVASNIDSVKIEAEPEDDDYDVTIDNRSVNSKNQRTVNLDLNKKNKIKVKVKNEDDEYRIYTLNITRGVVNSSNNSSNNNSNNTSKPVIVTPGGNSTSSNSTSGTTVKPGDGKNNSNSSSKVGSSIKNKWVKKSDGNWQYYDANGFVLKNKWFKGANNKWYYLKDDGTMKTSWLKNNNKWYYLNYDGSMFNGWIKLNGFWYYFNNDGSMLVGWYKIGDNWYYSNADGAMRTGWLQEGKTKYYLNSDGTMQKGQKTISGVNYNFAANGQLIQ
ncbi:cadherin-like beta sandwich domain-containing protein [Clostridium taeniosporum]|uniref:Choline-binding protein A n=1 Tax=Clostridium taeniosporum TaxID=394958 RepID=A0A1D7XMH7_9CLOT|nr:cadherin-like beta sandwich domain-containing protein [Clostridium taeniosporum]AOR24573.1 choline-binding protein A [Clostridium taeniosporum]